MTGFDGIKRQVSPKAGLAIGAARPKYGPKEIEHTSIWDDLLYYAGKGEESMASIIGSILTDDPKYDWSRPTNLYNRPDFQQLFRDAGVDTLAEEATETDNAVTSASLGLVAGILLDPIGKLKIAGLTKKGATLSRAQKGFGMVSDVASKKVKLDTTAAKAALAAAKLAKDSKSVSRHSKVLRELDEYNKVLSELQTGKNALSPDQLKLAGSTWEQIRQGQRRLIGLSSPTKLDQLSLFGIGRSELDNAVSIALPGFKGVESSLVKNIGGATKAVGTTVADATRTALRKVGFDILTDSVQRGLSTQVRAIIQEGFARGVKHEMIIQRLAHILGPIPEANRRELLDLLEFAPEFEKPQGVAFLNMLRRSTSGPVDVTQFKVGKDAVFKDRLQDEFIPGSALDDKDMLVLRPSGLTEDELRSGNSLYAKTKGLTDIGDSKAAITSEFVILRPDIGVPPTVDNPKLKEVYGIANYDKVPTIEGQWPLFMARKLVGGQQPVQPFNTAGKTGAIFQSVHANNLEVAAAQLANRKYALVDVKPGDLIINEAGSVQIINPDVIKLAKSPDAASKQSIAALSNLYNELGLPTGLNYGFERLKTGTARIAADKQAKTLLRTKKKGITSTDIDADVMPTASVIHEAENMGRHRVFLSGQLSPTDSEAFAMANKIQYWIDNIKQQINANQKVVLPPVELVRDTDGFLHVRSGRDVATAAAVMGLDYIPIRKVSYIGQTVDYSTYNLLNPYTANHLFANQAQAALKKFDDKLVAMMGVENTPMGSGYKVVNDNNFYTTPNPADIASERGLKLIKDFSILVTHGRAGPKGALAGELLSKLVGYFGGLEPTVLGVSKLLKTAQSRHEIRDVLESILLQSGSQLKLGNMSDSKMKAFLDFGLGNLSKDTDILYNELTSKGIFTEYSNPIFYKGTTEFLNEGKIYIQNQAKTLEELGKEFVDRVERNQLEFDDLVPYQHIVLSNGAQNIETTANELLRAIGRTPKGLTENLPITPSRFHISDEFIQELKNNKVMFVRGDKAGLASAKAELAKTPVFDAKLGRPLSPTADGYAYPILPYFMTESGDMFISTADDTVEALLTKVYKEGPRYFSEYGFVSYDDITINNPFGGVMKKVGKAETKRLESRLKVLASKLTDLGIDDSLRVKVQNIALPPEVWDTMVGNEQLTLGLIKSKKWGLKLNDVIKDMPLQVTVDARTANISLKAQTFSSKAVEEAYNTLRRTYTDLTKEELDTLVPVEQIAGYSHRVVTNEAKQALAKMHDEAIKVAYKQPTVVAKHYESFLKARSWGNYSTTELNDLVVTIRRAKQDGLTPDDIEAMVIDKLVNDGDFVALSRFSEHLNSITPDLTIGFYHQNALLSALHRSRESVQAVTRQKIEKLLIDNGVIKAVNLSDFTDVIKSGDKEVKLLQQARNVELDIAKTRSEIEKVRATGQQSMVDSYTKELEKLEKKHGEIQAKVLANQKDRANKLGVLGNEADLDKEFIYTSGDQVRKLFSAGTLKEEDILSDIEAPFVKIRYGKYLSHLSGGEAKIYLFGKENEPLINHLFGVANNRNGQGNAALKFIDKATSIWRDWTLYPVPAYHTRNFISNGMLMWFAGLTDYDALQKSGATLMTLFKFRNNTDNLVDAVAGIGKGGANWDQTVEMLRSSKVIDDFGRETDMFELWDGFIKAGGSTSGLHFNEFKMLSLGRPATSDAVRALANTGLLPSSYIPARPLLDNKLLRGGRKLAGGIEDFYRFGAYIAAYKKTGDFQEAAMTMKKVFFDYSSMNQFERAVLRRFIPFYSWLRFNIPRMMEVMVTDPAKPYRIGHFMNDLESGALGNMPVDERQVPQWIKDHYGLIVGRDKATGNYLTLLTDGFYPMVDLYKWIDRPHSMITEGLTPFMKYPIEALRNKRIDSDITIERYPGQTARSYTLSKLGFSAGVSTEGPLGPLNVLFNEHAFRSFMRLPGSFTKIVDSIFDSRLNKFVKPDVTAALSSLFIARLYEVNPDQTRIDLIRDWQHMRRKMDNALEFALSSGDTSAAQHLRAQIMYLNIRKPY